MQEMQFQSLGWEDPLEKEMATYSSIIAWEIPWIVKPGGLYVVHGLAKSRTQLSTCARVHTHTQGLYNLLVCISLTYGQRIMWADWRVEGGPVVPEELHNHSVTQTESLPIDTAIMMCKEFN